LSEQTLKRQCALFILPHNTTRSNEVGESRVVDLIFFAEPFLLDGTSPSVLLFPILEMQRKNPRPIFQPFLMIAL
jgi:hypothetical protein